MKGYAKTPTIYQMEATECGAACLSMIFAYFGKHVPLEQMRIETGVSRDGCNAGNIMRCAKRYGLNCRGFRKEPEALEGLPMPCIIHWNYNHFVVLEGFKGRCAYINDPATGRHKVTYDELDESFTGVVMTFSLTESFVKEKKKNGLFSFVFHRLKGQYISIAKLIYTGLLLVFPGILFPILSQIFTDEVLIESDTSDFKGLIIFMLASVFLQAGLTVYRNFFLLKLQKKMVLLSARDFISDMFRLPMNFFDQRYVGDLVSRINDNSGVSDFLAGELAETVLNILVSLFYLILLVIYSPLLTLIALATMVINFFIVKLTSALIADKSVKLQQDSGKLTGAVCAGISITSTLKASGAENEYVSRILGYDAKRIHTEQKLNKAQYIINAVPDAVKLIADVLIFVVGGALVIDGKLTVGMLVAFTSLFGSFSEPIEALVGFVKGVQTTKADIGRVEDIVKYPEDEKFDTSKEKSGINTKLGGSVEMRNVTFGYSRFKNPVISDLSFQAKPGQLIAFVGFSGSGKSTVSKIVSGLYKPWQGQLLFDGIPVEEIPLEVLSASVSTVSQNISLFSGTVKDNLTMWNKNISEANMIAAARDACIHDFIVSKPGGYNYKLSEGGMNLSGGQRQRLEIARALTLNPSVLIMDEATSALDPITEKQITDNIKRRGCTCIIVAHRLSTIRDCDEIIVLDGGEIVQRGKHDKLASVQGCYRDFMADL